MPTPKHIRSDSPYFFVLFAVSVSGALKLCFKCPVAVRYLAAPFLSSAAGVSPVSKITTSRTWVLTDAVTNMESLRSGDWSSFQHCRNNYPQTVRLHGEHFSVPGILDCASHGAQRPADVASTTRETVCVADHLLPRTVASRLEQISVQLGSVFAGSVGDLASTELCADGQKGTFKCN